MAEETRTRPGALYVLIGAVAFQGLSGVAGGFGLVVDPRGAMGIPLEWLAGSPFADYLIPGIVLLMALGIAPLAVAYGLMRGRVWSWAGSLLVGVALSVWLGVEIAIIGYHANPPLQLVYGLVAVVIVVLGLLPSVRKHFRAVEER